MDLQRQRQQAAQQPAGSTWTGQWVIRDSEGRELHKFGGIGNNQADANRVAAQWARDNQRGGEINVVPEMR
jgi:hypothetical protein